MKPNDQTDYSIEIRSSEADDVKNNEQSKPFLKRTSKNMESQKLDWENIERKIDCWNDKKSP